jgi:hypothetical protein
MQSEVSPFGALPEELLVAIFRLLDPIGLISIHQTSTRFRAIIQPDRALFLERLLELECKKEIGGVTPIFHARTTSIEPDFRSKEWLSMHWACSICLRLLPHIAFDNHSILRLRYRKPLPGSPAAASSSVTSWEPVGRQRFKPRQSDDAAQDKQVRHRYDLAVKQRQPRWPQQTLNDTLAIFQNSGMITFEGLSLEEYRCITIEEEQSLLDHEMRLIELERCGYKRHLRKCNECRFQRGETLPLPKGYGGPPNQRVVTFPIVRSRTLPFMTVMDRLFPGFSVTFNAKQPRRKIPSLISLGPVTMDVTSRVRWNTYMARCPICLRWQELRAFRLCGMHREWVVQRIPQSLLDTASCNHCLAREQGREKLAWALTECLRKCFEETKYAVTVRMIEGWRQLYIHRQTIKDRTKRPLEELESILETTEPIVRGLDHDQMVHFSLPSMLLLGEKHREWAILREEMTEAERSDLRLDTDWHIHYTTLEEYFIWTTECSQELEKGAKGEMLVKWALSQDSTALC